MAQIIPLDNSPNQTMQVTLSVNGDNLTLNLSFTYNDIAGYWMMGVADADNTVLIAEIPLLNADYPAANLLGQYAYMNIGSAYLIDNGASTENPDDTNLGTGWLLIWGNN